MVMIGMKNRRVIIQRQTTGTDSFGDVTRPFADVTTRWASIDPVRGDDKFIAMQVAVNLTHRVRLRYSRDLNDLLIKTPEFRLKVANNLSPVGYRYFEVNSAIVIMEQLREIEMLCTEKVGG